MQGPPGRDGPSGMKGDPGLPGLPVSPWTTIMLQQLLEKKTYLHVYYYMFTLLFQIFYSNGILCFFTLLHDFHQLWYSERAKPIYLWYSCLITSEIKVILFTSF